MSKQNEKEKRVMMAFNHQIPDRVPLCDGFWPEFEQKWRKEKKLGEDVDIYKYYDFDIRRQGGVMADQSPQPSNVKILKETDTYIISKDGWGRILKVRKDITTFHEELDLPIKGKKDFYKYEFESPQMELRFKSAGPGSPPDIGLKERVAELKKDFCVLYKTGGPYSRTSRFRGIQQFLMDIALDPIFVKDMVDRMTDHLIATMLAGLEKGELPKTAVWIADDIAGINDLFFSPKSYEKIFYPALKRICAAIKSTGRKVIYESEGNTTKAFDMLIDAGVEVFATLEPRAGMDIVKIKKKYGTRFSYIGNVCNVIVLPGGDKNKIKKEVLRTLSVAEEGGYIGGSAHSVGADISVESYDYMIELFREYGVYPLRF